MDYLEWVLGLSPDNLVTLRSWYERRESLGLRNDFADVHLKRPLRQNLNTWAARCLVDHLTHRPDARLSPEALGMLRVDLANVRWSETRLGRIEWAPAHVDPVRALLERCLTAGGDPDDAVAELNGHYSNSPRRRL